MQPNKRAKLNKILIIITIILVVITIICAISYIIIKNKKTEERYEDRVIAKNYNRFAQKRSKKRWKSNKFKR